MVEILEQDGSLTDADAFRQTDAGRLVAHVRIVGKIVGTIAPREQPSGVSNKSTNLAEAGGKPDGSHSDAAGSDDRTSDGPDFYPVPQRADALKADTRE